MPYGDATLDEPAREGGGAPDVVELQGLRQPGVHRKETFTKIKHLIEAASGTMDDIIRLDIYVTDIRQREEVWRARKEFFTGDFPTSTLVEVRALATPKLLVEINAIGFLGGSRA